MTTRVDRKPSARAELAIGGSRRLALDLVRPLPFVAALAWALAPGVSTSGRPPAGCAEALAVELQDGHLEASASDVHFIDRAPFARFRDSRALVRAHRPGELSDLFLVRAAITPEGALLRIDGASDITNTAARDERDPVVSGKHAAWVIGDAERAYRVELADLEGEPEPHEPGWTELLRLERALMNLQRTGQLSGIGRRSFKLDPAARQVSLVFERTELVVDADGHRIRIPFDCGQAIEGERYVREEDRTVARPGSFVTWAVDRARDSALIGDERMQWTKAVAYAAFDAVDRAASRALPEDSAASSEELGEALGTARAPATDPKTGWPPEPIPPLVTPALQDEGVWHLLDDDPFVQTTPGAGSALATAYLRPDGARPDSRVYIVVWDPRRVDLDMVAGTEEPQSATGETGDGMIPRRPEVLSHLVAAFNGAFQSTHGDYGMQVDGALLVPPKPYAATIARLSDGSVAFGTWPYDLTVPKDFVSFRQNLTPLVADGKYNPYGRDWWGGVPHDWEDETHTVRSGVCLMHEGFVAYFYGTQIDPAHLGRAMLAARCDYGLHLDMNQGHTGLELYRVAPAAELPPLPGKLDGHWQTEGDVLDMPGYRFRGRRLIKNLQLMHFPRYIRRGARDYFYLTLKPVLPGPPLDAGDNEGDDGKWSNAVPTDTGFPSAVVTTTVRPDRSRPETKVRVLKIDPRLVEPAAQDDRAPTLLVLDPPPPPVSGASIWLDADRFFVATDGGTAIRVATGSPSASRVAAASGVDRDGMLVYAEVATAPAPSKDGALLDHVLDLARCTDRIYFDAPLGFAVAGSRDLSDHPVTPRAGAVRWVRRTVQRARRIFNETPVLGLQDWMPLQRQTRFWPKPSADAPSGSSSLAPGPAPSEEP